MTAATSLDDLKLGTRAQIASVDWDSLEVGEASRLRHFGFDAGVSVEPLHLGPVRARSARGPRRADDRRDSPQPCPRRAR